MRPPPRDRNAPTKYDDSQAKGDEAVKKTRLKTVKQRRTNAFLPVPIEPLPEPLQQAEQDLHPAFQPPFRIDYIPFQYLYAQRSPLRLFLLFFYITALDFITESINSYTLHWRPQPL
jgi:hypothetical protein